MIGLEQVLTQRSARDKGWMEQCLLVMLLVSSGGIVWVRHARLSPLLALAVHVCIARVP